MNLTKNKFSNKIRFLCKEKIRFRRKNEILWRVAHQFRMSEIKINVDR